MTETAPGSDPAPDLGRLQRVAPRLRALAETRVVRVEDGAGVGGRLLQVRAGRLSLDLALDRGGDVVRLGWAGHELGWHSVAGEPAPWPDQDAEDGLGTMRGFDGFLVTCGLDHHGVPAETDAGHALYPLRNRFHHPLHGRIMAQRAEVLRHEADWTAGVVALRLRVVQAAVFAEALELVRDVAVGIARPWIEIRDRVTNVGFRPARHGILYHFNLGHPILGPGARLTGDDWALRDRLDGGAHPADDGVEAVDVDASPPPGPDGLARVGLANADAALSLRLAFDPRTLPVTALWRAFQSGTFALGLEPQTRLDADPPLDAGAARDYRLRVEVGAA